MKKPIKRASFSNACDELNYLNESLDNLRSIDKEDCQEFSTGLNRFFTLLQASGEDDGSIMLQHHWSLYYEIIGDFAKAVTCRQREIDLINRLFDIGGPIDSINYQFLSSVYSRLSHNYEKCGDSENAIKSAFMAEKTATKNSADHLI